MVEHAVGFARRGPGGLPFFQGVGFLTHRKTAAPLQDVVDLVVAPVGVNLLFLARFEAVDVAEHAGGFEEIHLLHFLGTKPGQVPNLFDLHDCSLSARGNCVPELLSRLRRIWCKLAPSSC